MKTRKAEELAERYKTWSNEDLIRAVTLDRTDYVAEALRAIEEELGRRNLTPEELNEGELEVEFQKRHQDDRLRGIGGWLAVFVIVIGFHSLPRLAFGLYWTVQARTILGVFLAAPELAVLRHRSGSLADVLGAFQESPLDIRRNGDIVRYELKKKYLASLHLERGSSDHRQAMSIQYHGSQNPYEAPGCQDQTDPVPRPGQS